MAVSRHLTLHPVVDMQLANHSFNESNYHHFMRGHLPVIATACWRLVHGMIFCVERLY